MMKILEEVKRCFLKLLENRLILGVSRKPARSAQAWRQQAPITPFASCKFISKTPWRVFLNSFLHTELTDCTNKQDFS
ncbi:MAG: hypothetical protein DPW21_12175 [Anaerolineae bacterium]|nr:hypothetical protein [Chloroflexi bacterium CFX1]MCQ3947433.1 hypothetical protein [Anaerolineae bacterium]OQY85328.1 MAG: hypothetical protein B6D40_03745 [Anaerolineae bacterium UTCFX3]RIK26743.1 MAG: hypothetical protein DCC54_05750 [Anaerolineae bacterium]